METKMLTPRTGFEPTLRVRRALYNDGFDDLPGLEGPELSFCQLRSLVVCTLAS